MNNNRRSILALYKNLLKYGQQLEYTSPSYFYKRVREEFEKHRFVTDQGTIRRLINKGESCLKRHRII